MSMLKTKTIISFWRKCFAFCLYIILVAAPFIGSISHGAALQDQINYTAHDSVICGSTLGDLNKDPHDNSEKHHSNDCCVLCTIGQYARIAEDSDLSFEKAFLSVKSISSPYLFDYPAPVIAVLNGVYPHDIPVRGPPSVVV